MIGKTSFELTGKRVYVAGHGGMVGQALVRRLSRENCDIITAPRSVDLRDRNATFDWFGGNQPDIVFVAAAKVDGIFANDSYPADFLYDNLSIASNVIEAARRHKIAKLLYLGSSCAYPKQASQPISEHALLTGPLEPTNEGYALAKIAGVKLCAAYRRQYGCDFISAMPTNLYGPGDNYHLDRSHVLPALIRKAHEAREAGAASMAVWGSGAPLREFMHVDDLADACVFLVRHYAAEEHINVGSGEEISIADLARLVCKIVGFDGDIVFDRSKPDGTPRKLMDSSRLRALGWEPSIGLPDGIADTYREWLAKRQDAETAAS